MLQDLRCSISDEIRCSCYEADSSFDAIREVLYKMVAPAARAVVLGLHSCLRIVRNVSTSPLGFSGLASNAASEIAA